MRFLSAITAFAVFLSSVSLISAQREILPVLSSARTCLSDINSALDSYVEARANIIRVEGLLSDTCALLNGQSTKWTGIKNFAGSIKNVPLGALPRLMRIVETGAAKVGSALGPPQKKTCDLIRKAVNLRKKYDRSPVGRGVRRLEKIAGRAENYVSTAERRFQQLLNATIIEPTCPATKVTMKDVRALGGSCKEVLPGLLSVTNIFSEVSNLMSSIVEPQIASLNTAVEQQLNAGALATVSNAMDDLLSLTVRLPTANTKAKPAPVVPTCCPNNANFVAGACLEKCPSGFTELGVICVKCSRGFVFTPPNKCVGGGFPPKIRNAKVVTPKRGPPSAFPGTACKCRTDGRNFFELGVCTVQCGVGEFANFPTSLGLACLDTRLQPFTLQDLAKNLDIIQRIKDVPILGDVLRAAERLVDAALRPIFNISSQAFDVTLPSLDFTQVVINYAQAPGINDSSLRVVEKVSAKDPVVEARLRGICRPVRKNPIAA